MKICLVVHKYSVSIHDPCCFPLGYMYVSSHLKALGHSVKVLNYNLWDYDLAEEIKGQNIVCFTGFEEFKSQILRDEKVCLDMGIMTNVGGALATFQAIPEFKGIQYRGEVDRGGDINSFPYPDYDGFGIAEYNKRHFIRYFGVLTGRGCPYSCTFCAQTCAFRLRDIGAVFDEIDRYTANYGAEEIVFNDNTLNVNKSRFMMLCEGMKNRRRPWGASIRCHPLDEDMVRAMRDSNCKGVIIGVESLRQEKLDAMNKGLKVEQIKRAMDLLGKYKIPYHGNLLVGFEDETLEEIQAEISSIPPEYNLFPVMVQPFVGTKIDKKRTISRDEYRDLDNSFVRYAKERGKTYSSEADGCL